VLYRINYDENVFSGNINNVEALVFDKGFESSVILDYIKIIFNSSWINLRIQLNGIDIVNVDYRNLYSLMVGRGVVYDKHIVNDRHIGNYIYNIDLGDLGEDSIDNIKIYIKAVNINVVRHFRVYLVEYGYTDY